MVLLLGGCASQVPLPIRQAPVDSPSLATVRADTASHLGRQMRWGGMIIETVNQQGVTRLMVLGRPLGKDGKPEKTDDSAGRFIAIVPAFLDPQVYAPERRVTVTGTLSGSETGRVGDYSYSYPVLQAEAWYLWPLESESAYDYDPWYYDPWYGPWYPYGYPFYRHPYGPWY
jgi:outer membrane lipoprotein